MQPFFDRIVLGISNDYQYIMSLNFECSVLEKYSFNYIYPSWKIQDKTPDVFYSYCSAAVEHNLFIHCLKEQFYLLLLHKNKKDFKHYVHNK